MGSRVPRVADTIERAEPVWNLGHSRSSTNQGRAGKNGNPYEGELAGGFSNFLDGKGQDTIPRVDASHKQHIPGYGRRNFHEKFASTVFTDTYEEDITKGPKNPDNAVARKNGQLTR